VPALFGWEDPGAAFTAVIQLGTMAAVLLYFWRDIIRIISTWARSLVRPELRGDLDARLGWYIGLGTIPIAVFGVLFQNQIEDNVRDLRLIGIALIAVGLIMLLAERVGSRRRELRGCGCATACPSGAGPGPGSQASRLGQRSRPACSRLHEGGCSALLLPAFDPAVVLSGLFELRDIGGKGGVDVVPTAVATLFAFVTGYASIAWLLRFTTHTMKASWSTVLLGSLVSSWSPPAS
jgi:undecaprenyl-diphosphatase